MAAETLWNHRSQLTPLSPGEIHLWQASLILPLPELRRRMDLLSADELARVNRLRTAAACRFAVARSTLRLILSQYLNCQAETIAFAYGDRGKPCLSLPVHRPHHLQFNLSHSRDVAVYALTDQGAIGVDVEYVRPVPSLTKLARRYFSPQECASLDNLTDQQQRQHFFYLWTQKEAYVKATGDGIPGLSTAMRPASWFFQSLQIEPDAVVAVTASVATGIRLFRWNHGDGIKTGAAGS
ncbi:MAG: 4'-phosphopantetheinyl transferase superfamily protein [Elainellaceae cyanobacterium]